MMKHFDVTKLSDHPDLHKAALGMIHLCARDSNEERASIVDYLVEKGFVPRFDEATGIGEVDFALQTSYQCFSPSTFVDKPAI
jgi:hypothetical protein